MGRRVQIDCELPPELLEAIAERAADLVVARENAPDPWLTAAEAAEHLRCPLSRVYALTSANRIPCHRDGSRLLFKRGDLDKWVEEGGGIRPG